MGGFSLSDFGGLDLSSLTDWTNPGSIPTTEVGQIAEYANPGSIPDFSMGTPDLGGGGGGGFNFGNMFNDLSGMAKTAAPILGLGVTGLGAVGGIQGMLQGAEQQKMLKQAQRHQQQIAAPAAQAGASLTAAGEQAMLGGALPGNLEALAAAREQELRAQIRSYFSHAGIQDSTMMAEYEGWIKQQTDLYRAQLAQGLTTTGFQGIQAATGANTPIMQSAGGQMGQTEKNLAGANAAIAAITGASDDRKRKQVGEV